MSLRKHLVNHMTLRKRHRLVAKEDHPFENGYDKSTLSYEKELPNMRVGERQFGNLHTRDIVHEIN